MKKKRTSEGLRANELKTEPEISVAVGAIDDLDKTSIFISYKDVVVKEQIGTAYEVKRIERGVGSDKLVLTSPISEDPPFPIAAGQTLFVKCPAEKDPPETKERFLEAEKSGQAINLAADRLAHRYDEKEGDPSASHAHRFAISKMLGRGKFQIGATEQECLVYEWIHGINSDDGKRPTLDQSSVNFENADACLQFAREFARAVKAIHNQGLVHSFIVPRNIIQNMNEPKMPRFTLVGFGYAKVCDARGRSSSPDVSPNDNRFRAPECRDASHSHAAFWFPADIYSIGAVLFYLLVKNGNPAKEEEKTSEEIKHEALQILSNPPPDSRVLKQCIAKALWKCQFTLIRQNENILKIIDSCLRFRASDRFSCIEELIEALSIAINATGEQTKDEPKRTTGTNATSVDSKLTFYRKRLWQQVQTELGEAQTSLKNGHFEVYGHRDKIIASLCGLLGASLTGHLYKTMTLPDYWTDSNLGSMGRFLTMNKHMARKGVKIERLFLVSKKHFHELPEEHQDILEQQLHALEKLKDEEKEPEGSKRDFDIRVYHESDSTIADFENEGKMVAFFASSEPSVKGVEPTECICLNFYSTAKQAWSFGKRTVKRQINKVRYWDPMMLQRDQRFQENVNDFQRKWDDAVTLKFYIHQGRGENEHPSINQLLEA